MEEEQDEEESQSDIEEEENEEQEEEDAIGEEVITLSSENDGNIFRYFFSLVT